MPDRTPLGAAPDDTRAELGRRTLHVWYVAPEAAREPGLSSAYRSLLSAAECARLARLRRAAERERYLVTRALVRTSLSRYAAVEPGVWTFREDACGRPEIAGPAGVPPLRFNVSHSDGLIACLVGLDRELGVDVERIADRRRTLAIAARFFAAAETAALRGLEGDAQRLRFFEYWTLKEAYLKARGLGLRLPLRSFALHLEGGPIRIAFEPDVEDDPASWQFELRHPTPRHVLAVALRRRDEPDLRVEVRPCVPLRSD